jgi:hypothetical protein
LGIIQAVRKSGKQLLDAMPGWAVVVFVLLCALTLKVALLLVGAFPFNADEAVVGLMARHMLQGRWPVFFYGQAYMGSLDASIVALGFAIFGQHVPVIRAVQVLMYLGTVYTSMLLARELFSSKRAVLITGMLMAIPTVNVTLYTTVSLGGYGEALLLGNLLLLLTSRIARSPHPLRRFMFWGFLAGLGFWGFGFTLVYSIPCFAVICWIAIRKLTRRKAFVRISALMFAVLLGASPVIFYMITEGAGVIVRELAGSAISGASPGNFLLAVVQRAIYFIVLGSTVILGMRPPWEVQWLGLPLMPFIFTFWILALVQAILRVRRREVTSKDRLPVYTMAGALTLGYLLTPFGADPSGRYFLPYAVAMALGATDLIVGSQLKLPERLGGWLLLSVLVFNLWGHVQTARRNPPGITTQFNAISQIDHRYDSALIEFLEGEGETRGYTNYWVAYPLAFLSQEKMVFTPRLPYHLDFRYTARDNRYSPYNVMVETSSRVAYITTNHAALDEVIRAQLRVEGISWQEATIGDYQIFYALSQPVRPEQIGERWLPE